MMVDQLLQAISQAGGHVTVDNGDLVLKAARSLPDDLLAELKAHKPEILAALARPNLSAFSQVRCPPVRRGPGGHRNG